jgi:hypothetical protein
MKRCSGCLLDEGKVPSGIFAAHVCSECPEMRRPPKQSRVSIERSTKICMLLFASICAILVLWSQIQAHAATHAAGSWATETTKSYGKINCTSFLWAADSTGAVTSHVITTPIRGLIYSVRTDPDTSVSPADSTGRKPSDNYDIVINITKAVASVGTALDIMGGSLANRDSINVEDAAPKIGTTEWLASVNIIYEPLTIVITGNIKPNARGRIRIYWIP